MHIAKMEKLHPPCPLSSPTPGKTPPSLGNRTTTVHAHVQAQKLLCKTKEYSGRTVLPSRS